MIFWLIIWTDLFERSKNDHFLIFNIYSCAFFSSTCNKLTPMSQRFTYNETIEIEDSNELNSLCLDCKTLNYFGAYIKPPEDDCYD